MKKFILINGKNAYIKKFKNESEARTYVTNCFDHSLYVGYYEVDRVTIMKETLSLI